MPNQLHGYLSARFQILGCSKGLSVILDPVKHWYRPANISPKEPPPIRLPNTKRLLINATSIPYFPSITWRSIKERGFRFFARFACNQSVESTGNPATSSSGVFTGGRNIYVAALHAGSFGSRPPSRTCRDRSPDFHAEGELMR